MTGWRLGYAAGPEHVIKHMLKIHQYAIMCAPTTSQYAAIEALREGDGNIRYMQEDYNQRRRLIIDGFRKSASNVLRHWVHSMYFRASVQQACRRKSFAKTSSGSIRLPQYRARHSEKAVKDISAAAMPLPLKISWKRCGGSSFCKRTVSSFLTGICRPGNFNFRKNRKERVPETYSYGKDRKYCAL